MYIDVHIFAGPLAQGVLDPQMTVCNWLFLVLWRGLYPLLTSPGDPMSAEIRRANVSLPPCLKPVGAFFGSPFLITFF